MVLGGRKCGAGQLGLCEKGLLVSVNLLSPIWGWAPLNSLAFSSSDIDAVLARANATEFGLASGVFTKDINKALYVSDKLQAGTVFVNTYNKTDVAAPFGGFKQSGFGKDLGKPILPVGCFQLFTQQTSVPSQRMPGPVSQRGVIGWEDDY